MSTLDRVRETSVRVAKVQRRIWLIQALFWPVVTITGVVIAFVVARAVWSKRPQSDVARPVATPQPAGLNASANGN